MFSPLRSPEGTSCGTQIQSREEGATKQMIETKIFIQILPFKILMSLFLPPL